MNAEITETQRRAFENYCIAAEQWSFKYILTHVLINGKFAYYLSPTTQEAYEWMFKLKKEFRGDY